MMLSQIGRLPYRNLAAAELEEMELGLEQKLWELRESRSGAASKRLVVQKSL